MLWSSTLSPWWISIAINQYINSHILSLPSAHHSRPARIPQEGQSFVSCFSIIWCIPGIPQWNVWMWKSGWIVHRSHLFSLPPPHSSDLPLSSLISFFFPPAPFFSCPPSSQLSSQFISCLSNSPPLLSCLSCPFIWFIPLDFSSPFLLHVLSFSPFSVTLLCA